ncbi:hypothetical protein MtrunA17_Chr7g0236431 [Medicago truncatula]|uniref:Transmembrane protein n=1 Tax=Medicago truncatula TaxID=3880 RepID=A0A396H4N5_MEDTR|nr:hypothetical protein MtrunA17_Chr7g0236431 [Medicago truncatula]
MVSWLGSFPNQSSPSIGGGGGGGGSSSLVTTSLLTFRWISSSSVSSLSLLALLVLEAALFENKI